MLIQWNFRDQETGSLLYSTGEVQSYHCNNFAGSGATVIPRIKAGDFGDCYSGTVEVTAVFKRALPAASDNPTYQCCEPYAENNGEQPEPFSVNTPLLIHVSRGTPEISAINIISSNQECSQALSAEISGGCREKRSIISPCTTEQYYEEYEWHFYDIITGDEIEDFLRTDGTFGTNQRCVAINPSHPYFLNFDETETPVIRAELRIVDYAGFTAEFEEILILDLPFRYAGPTNLSRCAGTTAPLFTGAFFVGNNGSPSISWDAHPFLNTANPLDPVFAAPSGYTGVVNLRAQGRDNAGCNFDVTIPVNVNGGIQVFPSHNGQTPVVTCLYESLRTLGRSEADGGVATGGSGNYNYVWTPAIGLSDPFIANPRVAITPPAGEMIYTLSVTDETGCSSSGDIRVVANQESQILANAGQDQTICYEGSTYLASDPYYTGAEISSPDISWEGSSAELVTIPIPFSYGRRIPNANVPGTHIFTLTVADRTTGCFDTDDVAITILEPWRYRGFNSDITMLVAGQEGELWKFEEESIILDGAILPLSSEWLSNEEPANITVRSVNNGIPSSGKFVPTVNNTEMTLLVTDAAGCQKEFLTNRYLLLSDLPQVTISTASEPAVFCRDAEMCYDVHLNIHPISQNTWLMPPNILAEHTYHTVYSAGSYLMWRGSDHLLHNGTLGHYFADNICFQNPGGPLYGGLDGNHGLFESMGSLPGASVSQPNPFHGNLQVVSILESSTIPEMIICDDTPPWYLGSVEQGNTLFRGADVIKVQFTNDCSQLYAPNASVGPLYENFSSILRGGARGMGAVVIRDLEVDEGAYFHAFIDPCSDEMRLVSQDDNDSTTVIVKSIDRKTLSRVEEKGTKSNKVPYIKAYPNPFYGETSIEFTVPYPNQKITLQLLNYAGNRIRFLEKDRLYSQGEHQYLLNMKSLPAGLYTVRMEIDGVIQEYVKIIAVSR